MSKIWTKLTSCRDYYIFMLKSTFKFSALQKHFVIAGMMKEMNLLQTKKTTVVSRIVGAFHFDRAGVLHTNDSCHIEKLSKYATLRWLSSGITGKQGLYITSLF